jgi:hypothetical protein
LLLQSTLLASKGRDLPKIQIGLDALDFHRPAALSAGRWKPRERDGAVHEI